MVRTSAGILPFRDVDGRREVLLVHPGGPFWAKKDDGAWSVAKGLLEEGDADALAAAKRELTEETGFEAPAGPYHPLGEVRLKSGKRVVAWAVEAPELDPSKLVSNTFEMEWPPRSGKRASFPEVDRAAWFDLSIARVKINAAQAAFLDRLEREINHKGHEGHEGN